MYDNIRSVSTNLRDVEVLIADLEPSVITVTETWFKNELLKLECYNRPFARPRPKTGGGLVIDVTLYLEAELQILSCSIV